MWAELTSADPKSAKKTVKLSGFFALLGSARVKAARRWNWPLIYQKYCIFVDSWFYIFQQLKRKMMINKLVLRRKVLWQTRWAKHKKEFLSSFNLHSSGQTTNVLWDVVVVLRQLLWDICCCCCSETAVLVVLLFFMRHLFCASRLESTILSFYNSYLLNVLDNPC